MHSVLQSLRAGRNLKSSLLCLSLLVMVCSALAQEITGVPRGTVKDLSDAVVSKDSRPVPGTPFTIRPTTYSGSPGYANPPLAYDSSLTTASNGSVSRFQKGSSFKTETWFGFPSAPPGASGMQLNINSAANTGLNGTAMISYSLNGGTTFTTVYFLEDGSRG